MGALGSFREHRHTAFGNAVILIFLCAQGADGVFTYLGVHAFGQMIEANPIVSFLMHLVGTGPALAGAKLAAIGCGSCLHLLTVHRVVAALTGIYLATAIGPWIYLLFMSPMRLFAF